MVFNINTKYRRVMRKVHKNQDKVIWYAASTDMYSYANTHYFGIKVRPISFMWDECNVYTFLSEYTEQLNIAICTGVTSLTLYYREVTILEFVQVL